jgi:protein-S-isoprenylcysteine O-methyltransferase Ste14
MALREELEQRGEWLFRRRSYLPLVLLVVVLAVMAAHPHGAPHTVGGAAWEWWCVTVSLVGVGVRVATVGYAPDGTSGRNTHGQVASVLNTTGAYALVRHPLYLGNYLMWLGAALFPRVAWLPVVVTLAYSLYYERIMLAEEAFLRQRFGATFEAWASVVLRSIERRTRLLHVAGR